jgi:hypothetical protein
MSTQNEIEYTTTGLLDAKSDLYHKALADNQTGLLRLNVNMQLLEHAREISERLIKVLHEDSSESIYQVHALANNIREVTNEISNTYGDIASIAAVTTILGQQTTLQRLVNSATEAVKQVAVSSEQAVVESLAVAVKVSQANTATLMAQATALKGNISHLLQSINDTHRAMQERVIGDDTDYGTQRNEEPVPDEDVTESNKAIRQLQKSLHKARSIAAKVNEQSLIYQDLVTASQNVYQNARQNRDNASEHWQAFLSLKSDVENLKHLSESSTGIWLQSSDATCALARKWNQVIASMSITAQTVEQVRLFILKRKATNTLISYDLVSDTVTASHKASQCIMKVNGVGSQLLDTLDGITRLSFIGKRCDNLMEMTMGILLKGGVKNSDLSLEERLQLVLKEAEPNLKEITELQEKYKAKYAHTITRLNDAMAEVNSAEAALSAAKTV